LRSSRLALHPAKPIFSAFPELISVPAASVAPGATLIQKRKPTKKRR
jgi:hypothetical protein